MNILGLHIENQNIHRTTNKVTKQKCAVTQQATGKADQGSIRLHTVLHTSIV